MIRKPVVLITGAGGEIGHGLIERLSADDGRGVITLDINPLEPGLAALVQREFNGSILDHALLERIMSEYEIDAVFHLAALLSTRAEFTPVTAHQVNVETHNGVVQLSGFVDTPEAKVTAETLASNVDNVKSVDNEIDVKK